MGQIAHLTPHRETHFFIRHLFQSWFLEKKNPQATERRSPAGVPRLKDEAANDAAVFPYYVSPRALILVRQGSKIIECAVFIFFCVWKKSGRILGKVDSSRFPLRQSESTAKPPANETKGNKRKGTPCNQLFCKELPPDLFGNRTKRPAHFSHSGRFAATAKPPPPDPKETTSNSVNANQRRLAGRKGSPFQNAALALVPSPRKSNRLPGKTTGRTLLAVLPSPPPPPTLLENFSNWLPPLGRSSHRKSGGSICRKSEVNNPPGGVKIVKAGENGGVGDVEVKRQPQGF